QNVGSVVSAVVVIADVDATEKGTGWRIVDGHHIAVRERTGHSELDLRPDGIARLAVSNPLVGTLVGNERVSVRIECQPGVITKVGVGDEIGIGKSRATVKGFVGGCALRQVVDALQNV